METYAFITIPAAIGSMWLWLKGKLADCEKERNKCQEMRIQLTARVARLEALLGIDPLA